MSQLTHQVIHNQEFKASEFPSPHIWEAEEVLVQGCNIIVDAPLPSHARYESCRFKGWPSFTPDMHPVGFASNYVEVMEPWVAQDNEFNLGGAKALTSLGTLALHREEGG